MKTIKLFLLTAIVTMFTACSDDDFNTKSVTVGFDSDEVYYNESDGLVRLPFVVEGERNGDIKVAIEIKENTAKDDVHFRVTSKVFNIPSDAEDVSVEMMILDDGMEENEDRDFTISIVQVQGGSPSEHNNCKIILKDVDAKPFFKLFGTFEAEAFYLKNKKPCNFKVVIDDEAEGTEEYLYGAGQPADWDVFKTKMIFGYNGDGTLSFEWGYLDGLYNFGSFIGVVSYAPYRLNAEGKAIFTEAVTVTYDKTYKTITFPENTLINTAVFSYDGGVKDYMGYCNDMVVITKLTRVEE